MVDDHDVDLLLVPVPADESVYRSFAHRFAEHVFELLQLRAYPGERRGTGLDVQDHIHVTRGTRDLHSRAKGV
ncbi:hypothetical protein ABQF35_11020 [Mycobacterium syngnathidarum]